MFARGTVLTKDWAHRKTTVATMKNQPLFRRNSLLIAATGRSFENVVHDAHTLFVRQYAYHTKWIVSRESGDKMTWDVLNVNPNVPTGLIGRIKVLLLVYFL